MRQVSELVREDFIILEKLSEIHLSFSARNNYLPI